MCFAAAVCQRSSGGGGGSRDGDFARRKRELDGRSWLERASTVPSTRFDLLSLQQRFEEELRVCRAKAFGVCPIRRRIYDELLGERRSFSLSVSRFCSLRARSTDEIIRQVTITCAERGLLLLRIRDELHLTILSYQTLLESAIAYGLRKAILVEQQQNQAMIDLKIEKARNADMSAKVGGGDEAKRDKQPAIIATFFSFKSSPKRSKRSAPKKRRRCDCWKKK